MTDNLSIYNKVRAVPKEAQKEIKGGRLSGKTDINPMWRLKTLTEQFGPCGIGWKYVITDKRLETGGNGEIAAFVDIDLFVKIDGAWSEAIPGTGGSMFVAKEARGHYTSDECYKMALTDAISVSCKALGFGADIYWDKDSTKYSETPPQQPTGGQQQSGDKPQGQASQTTLTGQNDPFAGELLCDDCRGEITKAHVTFCQSPGGKKRFGGKNYCPKCQAKYPAKTA